MHPFNEFHKTVVDTTTALVTGLSGELRRLKESGGSRAVEKMSRQDIVENARELADALMLCSTIEGAISELEKDHAKLGAFAFLVLRSNLEQRSAAMERAFEELKNEETILPMRSVCFFVIELAAISDHSQ